MQSIAFLLRLDDASFSQHILNIGIASELLIIDALLVNKNQSKLITRIVHRLLSMQDINVIASSQFATIPRLIQIKRCYQSEPLITNPITTLFQNTPFLLKDYLRMIQTSIIILESLAKTIEAASCGRANGKSSVKSQLRTDSPSMVCSNAILLMTSCIDTHLTLLSIIPINVSRDHLQNLFKSLVTSQQRLLFSRDAYVGSSDPFFQLSTLVQLIYELGNEILSNHSEQELAKLSVLHDASDFLKEMHLIYPPMTHQIDSLLEIFPLMSIKDALMVHKTVEDTLPFLLALNEPLEEYNDIDAQFDQVLGVPHETVMVNARRNKFDNDAYDVFNNATPALYQKTHIQKDISGIAEYYDEYDDTYLEDAIDDKERLLQQAVKNGIFTLPRGHKARVKVQQECQMDDHLFESWYKMFVKGGSVSKIDGNDDFGGNVRAGKQSWTDRKKGVFGGLHAADEVDEGEVEESVKSHHRGPVSNQGSSGRGRGGLKWGDRKKESSKKRAI